MQCDQPSQAQRRHLAAAAAVPTPRALDLGCGKGRHAMLLTDLGFEAESEIGMGSSWQFMAEKHVYVRFLDHMS